jgi:hypothetical protein
MNTYNLDLSKEACAYMSPLKSTLRRPEEALLIAREMDARREIELEYYIVQHNPPCQPLTMRAVMDRDAAQETIKGSNYCE